MGHITSHIPSVLIMMIVFLSRKINVPQGDTYILSLATHY